MRRFRFGPETSRHVTQFGSDFTISPLARAAEGAGVQVMHVAPGNLVGAHDAVGDQLFCVVAGSGWVAGSDDAPAPIAAGEAVLWTSGERHGAGSATGMTVMVIESRDLVLRAFSPDDEAEALSSAMDGFVVDDLAGPDIVHLSWSGDALHLAAIGRLFERDDADYLVLRAPNGFPVAKAAIDYATRPGAGDITQAAVHAVLQSCGLGTRLIAACEHRIRARGLARATLGVEVDNPRARALYARLGYEVYGQEPTWWDTAEGRYDTVIDLMRKTL